MVEGPWRFVPSTVLGATVHQEVAPRVRRFGYFRRINGNFQVTDNEALTAADFTRFNVQGGISTGKTTTDNCDIVADAPRHG